MDAGGIAVVASAVVGGGAGIVTWVRGKEQAYKDLVAHYDEMASKIYPVLRRKLKACCDPTTFLLGLQDSNVLGGGPVGAWWPALQEKNPGLVHDLGDDLRRKLDELSEVAARLDEERHDLYRICWGLLAAACEPTRQKLGLQPDEMPSINVNPSGSEGVALQVLWARKESIENWLNRTAPYRGGKTGTVDLHVSGHVLARERAAVSIIQDALRLADQHERLRKAQERARIGAQLAEEAMRLLAAEEQKRPRRSFLWPRLG